MGIEIKTGGFDLYDYQRIWSLQANTKVLTLVNHKRGDSPSQPTRPAGHPSDAILGAESPQP